MTTYYYTFGFVRHLQNVQIRGSLYSCLVMLLRNWVCLPHGKQIKDQLWPPTCTTPLTIIDIFLIYLNFQCTNLQSHSELSIDQCHFHFVQCAWSNHFTRSLCIRTTNQLCSCLYCCLVILPFSVSSIQKYHIRFFVKFISLLHRRTMLVVVKPSVTWTLDPNRPRKTRSRYNDIFSCIGKPKRSVTMSQK